MRFVLVGSALALLWYFALITEYPNLRPFFYASIAVGILEISLLVASYFMVENHATVPTLLYYFVIPIFFFSFSVTYLWLILRDLRTDRARQKQRLLKFHLLGFCSMFAASFYDLFTFVLRLESFSRVLPDSTVLALLLYGGFSTIILTDRLVDLVAEKISIRSSPIRMRLRAPATDANSMSC